MKVHTRRAVAFIAARLIGNKHSSSIYDYETGEYTSITGQVEDNRVAVYDHDTGSHINGSASSFYHHGNGAHLSLKTNGRNFTGYDYDSGAHFSGHVSGSSVSLYDYEVGSYFNFSI